MRASGIAPNVFAYTSLISACAKSAELPLALQLFQEMQVLPLTRRSIPPRPLRTTGGGDKLNEPRSWSLLSEHPQPTEERRVVAGRQNATSPADPLRLWPTQAEGVGVSSLSLSL
jgi:pentatricopeptide repeat protein